MLMPIFQMSSEVLKCLQKNQKAVRNLQVPFLPNVQFVLQSEKQDVQVNEMDNQIVSISADSVIKVWDMRSSRCLQTIVEKSISKPSRCNILYDNKRQVHTQLLVLHLLYAFKVFATQKQKLSTRSRTDSPCSKTTPNFFNLLIVTVTSFLELVFEPQKSAF